MHGHRIGSLILHAREALELELSSLRSRSNTMLVPFALCFFYIRGPWVHQVALTWWKGYPVVRCTACTHKHVCSRFIHSLCRCACGRRGPSNPSAAGTTLTRNACYSCTSCVSWGDRHGTWWVEKRFGRWVVTVYMHYGGHNVSCILTCMMCLHTVLKLCFLQGWVKMHHMEFNQGYIWWVGLTQKQLEDELDWLWLPRTPMWF